MIMNLRDLIYSQNIFSSPPAAEGFSSPAKKVQFHPEIEEEEFDEIEEQKFTSNASSAQKDEIMKSKTYQRSEFICTVVDEILYLYVV